MATDHRGNSINNNNLPKTTKDRMGLSDEQIENPDGTFRQLSERDLAEGYEEGSMTYPDGTTVYPEPYDEEMDEDPEQVRRAEQYAQEMYDYHKPLPSDRVYGKNEMIEHDRDDDKY
jgi:hypothetical protein